ncbi:MAG TPA: right-handed parallel beta-helix repeat-containing protein [Acidimicrobiales bacterium]
MTRRRHALLAAVTLALVAAGYGADEGTADEASAGTGGPDGAVDPAAEEVRAVPDEYGTIQEAVDAAHEGDLVLVSQGVYHEAVTVTTDDIVIRGLDRNEVILDGEFELDNGIRVLEADGVAVENMTARNYTTNGFFWTGVDRYRGSYLTAANNGDYGLYAFDSTTGLFEHSYGSGSPDAGFYIGQCYPCDAVIRDVVSENNGLGYSGTNAGGDLFIVESTFSDNRAGIVPNSGDYEQDPPERETTIVGNLVRDNSNGDTAAIESARLATGNGILVFGGIDNVIERNRVHNHDLTGIALVPAFDSQTWPVERNVVRDNVVTGSGLADMANFDEPDSGNCFAGNDVSVTAPLDLERLLPCDGEGEGDRTAGALDLAELADLSTKPESGDYRDQPAPPEQESMPDASSARWEAAGDPPEIDLDAIEVPDAS